MVLLRTVSNHVFASSIFFFRSCCSCIYRRQSAAFQSASSCHHRSCCCSQVLQFSVYKIKPLSFLIFDRADLEKAREMFERAIAADAGGVSPVGVYGAYAKFLWATGGDRDTIIEFFEKACAGASAAEASCAADAAAAADVMASYASFMLTGSSATTAKGEQLLRASLTLQPRNATTLTRYAHFLMDVMGDAANAARLLDAAVKVDPFNAVAATSCALPPNPLFPFFFIFQTQFHLHSRRLLLLFPPRRRCDCCCGFRGVLRWKPAPAACVGSTSRISRC